MRQVNLLINQSRRATGNTEFTPSSGVQDSEFLQYMNDGQEEIHSILNQLFPTILYKIETIDVQQNVEAYTLPRDVYLGTRVDFVEYAPSGLDQDFYPIKKGSVKERVNGQSSNPSFYIRINNQLFIQPKPQQGGKLRVTYQKSIPSLDLRRAQVQAVVLAGDSITSLTLDPAVQIDATELLEQGYFTVVDKDGAVKMQGIPIEAIDTSTGVVTLGAGFTFQPGETISVGDYLCAGPFAATTSLLPSVCEKFLIEYCNVRILMRDSNSDSGDVGQVLLRVQDTLTKAFAEPSNDPDSIPILDGQYFMYDY